MAWKLDIQLDLERLQFCYLSGIPALLPANQRSAISMLVSCDLLFCTELVTFEWDGSNVESELHAPSSLLLQSCYECREAVVLSVH
jgi:hypothetical protein